MMLRGERWLAVCAGATAVTSPDDARCVAVDRIILFIINY